MSRIEIEIDKQQKLFYKDIKYWNFVTEEWHWVRLQKKDIQEIERKAKIREDSNRNSKKYNYAKGDSLEGNIHGIAGEAAVALLYGSSTDVLQATDRPDESRHRGDFKDWEIKATKYGEGWKMYVNESTIKPERIYILTMTHFYPFIVGVIGWCYGREIVLANEPTKFAWREKERAYWISWHGLRPL